MRIEVPANLPPESVMLMALSIVNVLLAIAVSRVGARFTTEPDTIERDETLGALPTISVEA